MFKKKTNVWFKNNSSNKIDHNNHHKFWLLSSVYFMMSSPSIKSAQGSELKDKLPVCGQITSHCGFVFYIYQEYKGQLTMPYCSLSLLPSTQPVKADSCPP